MLLEAARTATVANTRILKRARRRVLHRSHRLAYAPVSLWDPVTMVTAAATRMLCAVHQSHLCRRCRRLQHGRRQPRRSPQQEQFLHGHRRRPSLLRRPGRLLRGRPCLRRRRQRLRRHRPRQCLMSSPLWRLLLPPPLPQAMLVCPRRCNGLCLRAMAPEVEVVLAVWLRVAAPARRILGAQVRHHNALLECAICTTACRLCV